jgi:hypothetical protein
VSVCVCVSVCHTFPELRRFGWGVTMGGGEVNIVGGHYGWGRGHYGGGVTMGGGSLWMGVTMGGGIHEIH